MNYLGEEYFYIKNMQGDILELINSDGHTVAKYSYDAWGNIIYQYDDGSNISNINPYRYRGYRYDDETGYYYLNTRYYDPSIARFISADSINYLDPSSSAGLNLYAYCNNNPVMYTDGDGTFPLLISLGIIFGIGALSGVAGTFIGDLTTSAMTGEWSFSSGETCVANLLCDFGVFIGYK